MILMRKKLTPQEVEFKNKQEFGKTEIRRFIYQGEKTLVEFPREALEFATSEAFQGQLITNEWF